MRDIHIDQSTADKWQKIADLLKTAKEAVDEASASLMIDLGITGGAASTAVHEAQDALSGQSYMFTPQSEWMGGDSTLFTNFKWRKPHIANIPDKDDPKEHCQAG